MKSKFWASVLAWVTTVVTFVLIWFIYGKPEDLGKISGAIAIVALYTANKNDFLRKED